MCGRAYTVFHFAPPLFCNHLLTVISCDDFVFGENDGRDEVVPKYGSQEIYKDIDCFLRPRKCDTLADFYAGKDAKAQIGREEYKWEDHLFF